MKPLSTVLCLAALGLAQVGVFAQEPPTAGVDTTATQIEHLTTDVNVLKDTINKLEGSIQTSNADVKKLKTIKVSGYVQARYEYDQSAEVGTTGTNKNTFTVRRARLKVSGRPTANAQAVVQLDAGEGSVTTKDAYLEYFLKGDPSTGGTITAGQFKWPFGYQVVQSSSVRETPERARVIRELFPGERDRGVKFSSATGAPWFWEVGVFNGTGANTNDNNNKKDIVGRVRRSLTPHLDAGISGYLGESFRPLAGATTAAAFDKTRLGVDVQYQRNTTSLKGELVTADDQGVAKHGYYLQLARDFTPKDTGVVMYDVYDAANSTNGTLTSWNLGWVHKLDHNTRVRAFYEFNGEEIAETDNDVLRVEMITTF